MSLPRSIPVAVIGAGQAGLAVSHGLKARYIDHVVLERNRIGEAWRSQRWESFCLVTPNWQCQLPGFPYAGPDPDGFMVKDEIVDYVVSYAQSFAAPVYEGVEVTAVRRNPLLGSYELCTTAGAISAEHVVVAIGGYHEPIIPTFARNVPSAIEQLHSEAYRHPAALPEGDVLVIGSGQSGCQIAEDLHLAGRKVHLCLGSAPRVPRFYRGKDVVKWLDELGHYDIPIEAHDDPAATRDKTNHYVTGRDGGRDIDLRQFALEGMRLYGYLDTIEHSVLHLRPDVAERLDLADAAYVRICELIDRHIESAGLEAPPATRYRPPWQPCDVPTRIDLEAVGIRSIVWSLGFRHDFRFVQVPVFDERGYPQHRRGLTEARGLYFVGLPWLHTWGSGRFGGVGRDAQFIVDAIATVR